MCWASPASPQKGIPGGRGAERGGSSHFAPTRGNNSEEFNSLSPPAAFSWAICFPLTLARNFRGAKPLCPPRRRPARGQNHRPPSHAHPGQGTKPARPRSHAWHRPPRGLFPVTGESRSPHRPPAAGQGRAGQGRAAPAAAPGGAEPHAHPRGSTAPPAPRCRPFTRRQGRGVPPAAASPRSRPQQSAGEPLWDGAALSSRAPPRPEQRPGLTTALTVLAGAARQPPGEERGEAAGKSGEPGPRKPPPRRGGGEGEGEGGSAAGGRSRGAEEPSSRPPRSRRFLPTRRRTEPGRAGCGGRSVGNRPAPAGLVGGAGSPRQARGSAPSPARAAQRGPAATAAFVRPSGAREGRAVG